MLIKYKKSKSIKVYDTYYFYYDWDSKKQILTKHKQKQDSCCTNNYFLSFLVKLMNSSWVIGII